MLDADALAIPNERRARSPRASRIFAWIRRRYDEVPPKLWIPFDIVFGIVVPFVCLYIDPLFGGDSDGPRLVRRQLAVYVFAGVEVLTLIVWLLIQKPSGVVASMLGIGAAFAALVSSIVLPISLVLGAASLVALFGSIGDHDSHPFDSVCASFLGGSMLLVGLGLSTPVVAFVYARNSVKALRQATHHGSAPWPMVSLLAGAALALAAPITADIIVRRRADRAIQEFLVASDSDEATARARLSDLRAFADPRDLERQYRAEQDDERRKKLARAYRVVARRSID